MKPGSAVLGAVVALALALAALAVLFTWGGLTHRKSWPLETQIGDTAVGLSAKLHAGKARNLTPPAAQCSSSLVHDPVRSDQRFTERRGIRLVLGDAIGNPARQFAA